MGAIQVATMLADHKQILLAKQSLRTIIIKTVNECTGEGEQTS